MMWPFAACVAPDVRVGACARFLLVLPLLACSVFGGKVETLDHRTFEGVIRFKEDGRLTIQGTNRGVTSLALGEVRVARLNHSLEQATHLPSGWRLEEIGGAHGNAVSQDGAFLLRVTDWRARGAQVQPAQFVYRMVRSEPEIAARVESLSGEQHCAAGVMLREDLGAAGGLVLLAVTPGEELLLESRESNGQDLRRRVLGRARAPVWLKLGRRHKDETVLAYRSSDGSSWEEIGQARLYGQSEPVPEDSDNWRPKLYAGLALTGAQSGAAATARMDQVSLRVRGLLGQYYSDEKFGRLRFARLDEQVAFRWRDAPPAPDMAAGPLAVRWTGQVEPRYTEAYRFHCEADDSARLWVNGEELPDAKFLEKPEKYERVKELALSAGQKCEVTLEFANEEGAAGVRLGWSSARQKLEVIPGDCLSYLYSAGSPDEENEGAITNICHRKGIYLREGSFLAGEVVSADATVARIQFAGAPQLSVATARIGWMAFRNLRRPLGLDQVAGRSGVFLKNGDFMESELVGLKSGLLTVNSILFGPRRFSTQKPQTAALVLHRAVAASARYEVTLADGSSLRARGIRPAAGGLVVEDVTLGPVRVAEEDVDEIRNIAGRGWEVE